MRKYPFFSTTVYLSITIINFVPNIKKFTLPKARQYLFFSTMCILLNSLPFYFPFSLKIQKFPSIICRRWGKNVNTTKRGGEKKSIRGIFSMRKKLSEYFCITYEKKMSKYSQLAYTRMEKWRKNEIYEETKTRIK